ncbi:MAG: hypothetical protein A2580_16605 [Hydrogenophilales bacterium RIFOXYD1_FULL_62_11]|nr:MAG: hypothetical protein A2580_16605 [Hydrogenophilales bacterium RIFOXYD1_FULL_62_11]
MNKKFIASAIAGLGLAASGSASAIVVGGVDFGAAGLLSHLETTTVAETFISGNGQQLLGYGQVNTVNGNLFYGSGSDRLYFVFDQYVSNDYTFTTVDFSAGQVRVYLMPTFNLLAQDSATNFGLIDTGTPWAVLEGHGLFGTTDTLASNGQFTGDVISFSGAGLLDVVGGEADVVAFLDSDGIGDGAGGFADIAITTSGDNAVLNPFDNTDGCTTGDAVEGQWCIAGSADLRGLTTVPEPGVLALVGLGLLGMGVSLRKRKSA